MANKFNELKAKVEKWAEDKGILEQGTTHAQAHKTLEEASEIVTAITQNDRTGIIDGIGDTLVTLIIQAKMNDLDILECLEYAYNEIANRKGEMINGTFVKEK